MRKQTKIAAIASAAALLAIGASMTSFAAGWDQDHYNATGEWIYKDADGDRVYGEWRKSGKDFYYLDETTGVMATDRLVEYNGEWYYVNDAGIRVAGQWQAFTPDEDIYLSFEQEFDEGILEPGVIWYYFDPNTGKAYRGTDDDGKITKEIGGKYYVFNEVGQMLSGWVQDGDNYYYLNSEDEGWAATGWKQIYTTTQGDNGDGAPFESTSDQWFHFSNTGVMDKAAPNADPKCVFIDNKYYYFNERGVMLADQRITVGPASPAVASYADAKNVWVRSDGSTVINGWYDTKDDNGNVVWYYLINKSYKNEGQKPVTVHGVPFGMRDDGKVDQYIGKMINGKKYLFRTSDGQMVTGKVTLTYGGNLVFDTNTAGRPITETFGLEAGETATYFFDPTPGSANGHMLTGKVEYTEVDDTVNTYFCQNNGKAYKSVIVNGCLYDETGACVMATDGNNYQLVNITEAVDGGIKYWFSNKKDEKNYIGKDQDKLQGKYYIVVSSSGKIKKSANKLKVGDDYVEIKDYIVTDWKND